MTGEDRVVEAPPDHFRGFLGLGAVDVVVVPEDVDPCILGMTLTSER